MHLLALTRCDAWQAASLLVELSTGGAVGSTHQLLCSACKATVTDAHTPRSCLECIRHTQ